MQRTWQVNVRDDPLSWLLEEKNPSARYLALRHLLDCADCDSQAADARAAISEWPPVREILALMDPVDFWGQAEKPFYGGAMSTHATLHLLADLGMDLTPQLEAACENLLEHGQHERGGFSDGTEGRVLLCHTGNAVQTLIHFGYRHDPRVKRALAYLAERCATSDGLTCLYADGEQCQWGIAKVLGAFANAPPADCTAEQEQTTAILADAVLGCSLDCKIQHPDWLNFGFPLDYQSDLIELCDVLARLEYGTDPRFQYLLDIVLDKQTAVGRWIKHNGTRALQVEDVGQPSKWITIRALRAIKHAHHTVFQAERAELEKRGA
ncbi:MAG: hypothetical protein JXA14_18340 [Anaerolineae bacterium]|nr:hypothetical protein [Anaerolineae bacterium]